ncbi:hypothetical protein GQ55_9G318900 [Panicum hallii var. hallii]|uniref:Uncharacterized protein n=1 Tax=Panicum hallii var. hallii TaxID=1504633 RepID=A0A2T7C831_9POAL|nr:hypothetical protein GQ55_9G318900 [Panicum hallii var. hallii]
MAQPFLAVNRRSDGPDHTVGIKSAAHPTNASFLRIHCPISPLSSTPQIHPLPPTTDASSVAAAPSPSFVATPPASAPGAAACSPSARVRGGAPPLPIGLGSVRLDADCALQHVRGRGVGARRRKKAAQPRAVRARTVPVRRRWVPVQRERPLLVWWPPLPILKSKFLLRAGTSRSYPNWQDCRRGHTHTGDAPHPQTTSPEGSESARLPIARRGAAPLPRPLRRARRAPPRCPLPRHPAALRPWRLR